MSFVGVKKTVYTDIIPESGIYPELSLATFQQQFGVIEEMQEAFVVITMTMASVLVQKQIMTMLEGYDDLESFSEMMFGSADAASMLYQQAVYCKTAADLLGRRLSTDATKMAADRQQVLNDQHLHLMIQYRESVDLLIGDNGYKIELV